MISSCFIPSAGTKWMTAVCPAARPATSRKARAIGYGNFRATDASINLLRLGAVVHELKGLINQDSAGSLAQAGARNVIVPFEAVVIFLGKDVAERVIGQAEQQVVL